MPVRPPGLVDGLTPLQAYLQEKHKKPIRELLVGGTQHEIADMLGIEKSTVSVWRQQLGMVNPYHCHRHDMDYIQFCPDCWLDKLRGGVESE